jgi:hypothetical protein
MPPKKTATAARETVSRETEIVFPEEEDMLFMGQNIFGHDFIHDFNATTMGARLTKIKAEIDAFLSTTRGGDAKGGDAKGIFTGGEETDPEGDERVDTTEYMLLDNYELIRGAERLNESEKLNELSSRPNTRAKVRLMNDMQTTVQELKLYHYGYIHSINNYERYISDEEAPDTPVGKTIWKAGIGGAVNEQVKLSVNQFKFCADSIRDGFRKVINSKENKVLRSFYIAMLKVYLILENPEIHPYITLNSSFIEKAMMIYLVDPVVFTDSVKVSRIVQRILYVNKRRSPQKTRKNRQQSRNDQSRSRSRSRSRRGSRSTQSSQGGMKGGVNTPITLGNIKEMILTPIEEEREPLSILLRFSREGTPLIRSELLEFIRDTGNTGNKDLIENKIDAYSNILYNFNSTGRNASGYEPILLNEIVRIKNILPVMRELITISRAKLAYVVGRKRTAEEEIYMCALANVIINTIYEPLQTACNDVMIIEKAQSTPPPAEQVNPTVIEILNESPTERKGLSVGQRDAVQQISVCVAKGVLDYIGDGNKSHPLLNTQTSILGLITNNYGFGQADENILKGFRKYVENRSVVSPQNASKIKKYTDLINLVDKVPNKVAINNAANKPMIGAIRLNDSIVCPNSSIVDAMGDFGSCSKGDRPREKYNMEFTLTNRENDYYYTGQSILNGNKLKIIYSASINDFVLPYVQLDIDIKSAKHVVALSANNTFKSILNKITAIWTNMSMSSVAESSLYWNALFENKTFFQELVSVGSIKSVGDLFQEINSTALNGSYINADPRALENQVRIGIMGDRPSGVRAGFILYRAISGTHPKSIAGYFAENDANSVVISSISVSEPTVGKSNSKKK